MKLIIGLGNAGAMYQNTRHNIGARAVTYAAKKHNVRLRLCRSLKSRIATIQEKDQPCILMIPYTFMNVAGQSVALVLDAKKIEPRNILIVHDDMDLEAGTLRLKKRGGAGGHKGIDSVIRSLHTNEFNRLKLGIGKTPCKAAVSEYVLSAFPKRETPLINALLRNAVQACTVWIQEGIDRAMNQFN